MKNKNKILDIVGGILGGILVLGLCVLPFWPLKQEIDLMNKCKYTIIDANGAKYHAKSFKMVRGFKIIKLVDYQDRKITIYGVKTIIEK
jgi:hypothetical protein